MNTKKMYVCEISEDLTGHDRCKFSYKAFCEANSEEEAIDWIYEHTTAYERKQITNITAREVVYVDT